jgi:hypothetical protein
LQTKEEEEWSWAGEPEQADGRAVAPAIKCATPASARVEDFGHFCDAEAAGASAPPQASAPSSGTAFANVGASLPGGGWESLPLPNGGALTHACSFPAAANDNAQPQQGSPGLPAVALPPPDDASSFLAATGKDCAHQPKQAAEDGFPWRDAASFPAAAAWRGSGARPGGQPLSDHRATPQSVLSMARGELEDCSDDERNDDFGDFEDAHSQTSAEHAAGALQQPLAALDRWARALASCD